MSDVNLIVAGAGGGLAGALRAHQLGLSVLVVEANQHFLRGNNTSMSTAMVPGAGSRFQREAGIDDDSPDRFRADAEAKTKGRCDRVVTEALTEVSGRLVEWMADDIGLPMEVVTDFAYPGHSRHRCHTVPDRAGASMLGMLHQAVTQRGIDLLCPARLVDARREHDHVVAVVEYPDGTTDTLTGDAILLATNGFGADPELVRRYVPEIADAVYHGSEMSRGDALRIGERLDASLACMDAYQGHGALTVGAGTLAGWATVMHGGFIVNSEGSRFADETQGYSEFAAVELTQPGQRATIVYDERVHQACLKFEDYRQTVAQGVVRQADDIASLADRIGVDPAALEENFEAVERARNGEQDPFHRQAWGPQQLTAPFHAVQVQPALFHTQGGIAVDARARVLTSEGTPIENVYAAGGAAVGMSGNGAAGYLAGNGLLAALGLSFLAAEDCAARLAADAPAG